MKIYTKVGDKGSTSLLNKKISKSSSRIDAIGTLDELNSFLGIVISFGIRDEVGSSLQKTQSDLFQIGSMLVGKKIQFTKRKVARLEKEIDLLEKKLPKLKNFVFPGGEKEASLLFFARSVARRLERKIVLLSKKENVPPILIVYVNRLSDYLFVLARSENYKLNPREKIWKM